MRGLRLLFAGLMLFVLSGYKLNKHDQMVADLEFIGSTFDVHYAPALWKKEHVDWDLNRELALAKELIADAPSISVKEYQKIIRNFFRSTHDYHNSVRFHSTEAAILPFSVIGVKERYFIVHVNPFCLSPKAFMIQEGDELITFGQKPVHQAVLELQEQEFGTTGDGTDRALATMMLTQRKGSHGSDVPHGPIEVGVRRKGHNSVKKFQLIWCYAPEQITHSYMPSVERTIEPSLKYERSMLTPFFEQLHVEADYEINKHALGRRKGFLPNLGKVWWRSPGNNPFDAYLWEDAKKRKIGYVRIPHYIGDENEAHEFMQIIAYFEENSDALVIDQLNNPGGSVFYLYALASMLTERPLETPKHRMTLTPREVEFAVKAIPLLQSIQNDQQAQDKLGETLSGYPVNYQTAQFILEFCRFTVQQWNQGNVFTMPTHLYGVDQINPHPYASYSKPILVLINELDFSGGDFFPAILQDNERAVLMGTKTAGAGGFVARMAFPNRFGIDNFHYTASIAERSKSKEPIENLGIRPDIEYELTPADVQNQYRKYVQSIRQVVDGMLN